MDDSKAMVMHIEKPSWACENYGGYEHDWLECPECIKGYEKDLELYYEQDNRGSNGN